MSSNDDYDKLSPEEREARDKADRAREAAEQAGAFLRSSVRGLIEFIVRCGVFDSPAIKVDTAAYGR